MKRLLSLDVELQQFILFKMESADRGNVLNAAMRSMRIVVADPFGQIVKAMLRDWMDVRMAPLAHRIFNKALGRPIDLGRVGVDSHMPKAAIAAGGAEPSDFVAKIVVGYGAQNCDAGTLMVIDNSLYEDDGAGDPLASRVFANTRCLSHSPGAHATKKIENQPLSTERLQTGILMDVYPPSWVPKLPNLSFLESDEM